LDEVSTISKRFDALLYSGTYKTTVKIRLLDTDRLNSNESALVQIDLLNPWYYYIGENFILRNTSSDKTIGGGFVIDPLPLHHKKRKPELIAELKSITADPTAFITFKIKKSNRLLTLNYFEKVLQWDTDKLQSVLESENNFKVLLQEKQQSYVILDSTFEKIEEQLLTSLSEHQSKVTLDKNGASKDTVKLFVENLLPYHDVAENQKLFDRICQDLEVSKKLYRNNNLWSTKPIDIENRTDEDKDITELEKLILEEGVTSVGEKRIVELGESLKIPYKKTKSIIRQLTEQNRIKRYEKYFIHKNHIDSGRNNLLTHYEKSQDGLTVADFRDLIGGNRRIALNLFDTFEREGLVYREGDFRFKK